MEIPGQDTVVLRSFTPKRSTKLNAGKPEKQDDPHADIQPESNQAQELIKLRIEQLCSRRFVLLKMKCFRKKAEDKSGRNTQELISEDSDEVCELDTIQKELEELLAKKEQLEKQGNSSDLSQPDVPPTYKTETPNGGIYLLPLPHGTRELMAPEQRVQTEATTGQVVPVDSLDQTPAVTQCPSCQQVVFTETRSTLSQAMWMLCCLSAMMGCVAGCCLLPFLKASLRDVQHRCPQCQAHIHTHKAL
uniref:lipopolysaccharide-induced tumor necrosis factor-alpha factor homolog n=1 Tax=Scatophagus argus TaxID=75038 RepID=UPI001ED82E9F|nr:lipopolysaccharide-induced tumor necrosis factor-alpha factor homolog [Scatophagus argus]